ncbi:hypothetical protein XELAEV_18031839mg [Xenopus laevis]|uniref:Uncharacterized protein n=1 Tax=Xenopus laevis TaxID=8355 RepID=A0A974CN97_XENLA|nr:hypothetical protein XELAEV_18031839mg [Xenopus laevis]
MQVLTKGQIHLRRKPWIFFLHVIESGPIYDARFLVIVLQMLSYLGSLVMTNEPAQLSSAICNNKNSIL